MRTVLPIVLAVAVSGCGPTSVVTSADRRATEAWVAREMAPQSGEIVGLWHSNDLDEGMLCGEIDAPPERGNGPKPLHFVYDPKNPKFGGQIEFDKAWAPVSGGSSPVLDANRAIFNDLWAKYCAPYAPLRRRIASWFAG